MTKRPESAHARGMPTPPTARTALDALGIDAFCDEIANGKSLTKIAEMLGCNIASVSNWLSADAQRSARARQTRAAAAWYWDEQAEQELRDAALTPEAVAKARELAQHFRWRAKVTDPANYGDKVDMNHRGVLAVANIPVEMSQLTIEQRETVRDVLLLSSPRAAKPEGDENA